MKLFKLTLAPLLGQDDKGEPTRVGGWMCYATAREAAGLGDVLRKALPDLFPAGQPAPHEVDEQVSPRLLRGRQPWSVSVGPEGRTQSFLLIVGPGEALEAAVKNHVAGSVALPRYVDMGLWNARKIDMKKENVW